ncbi:MAG TPA: hypothetical protein VFI73_14135 [Candidatus Nitrosopolaris sp.]|nr:hypothetical protein [Candidatus Nitrosopolaris sp.]
MPAGQQWSRTSGMTNNNKNNIHQQNNTANRSFDDFVFNPKTAILEPKCKPIWNSDGVNDDNSELKDYDTILTCDLCRKAVGFFSIADVRPYIDSPMFLCIDCLRRCDRSNLSDEAQIWFEDENVSK